MIEPRLVMLKQDAVLALSQILGIMLDDLLAAFCAAGALAMIRHFFYF